MICKNNYIYFLLTFYAIGAVLILLFFNGTGDSGDSVHHYLYAKSAFSHPEHFFNHWAKPVYVLLASPFAQLGFVGVKIFNVLISIATIFLTYHSCLELKLKNSLLGALIIIMTPLYLVLTFSGLTEPLFALFIALGLFATLKQKYIAGSIIISFLPFVRSEGLIIMGVFGLYYLLKKQWKLIPLLSIGHIVYSLAGYFVFHDLLWVFNKIPYARMSSTYGSGKLFHFVDQLNYVIGIPVYILFVIGVVSLLIMLLKKRINHELHVLIFLGFLSFFVAHSLFWYLGIFNSMGLKRVLLGVIPFISIISLVGFNFITEELLKNKPKSKLILSILLLAYLIVFPFTPNPASIKWPKDFNLGKDQELAIKTCDFIKQSIGIDNRFVFAHSYLSELLNIDNFDSEKHINLSWDFMNHIKKGDIIIWENWYAVVENGVKKEQLDNNPDFANLFNISSSVDGREIVYVVYERK